jgi:hypothetical protein
MILKYGEVPRLLGARVGLFEEIPLTLMNTTGLRNFKIFWAVVSRV